MDRSGLEEKTAFLARNPGVETIPKRQDDTFFPSRVFL